MHHWIVEVDVFETRDKEHAKKRDEFNDRLIGTLTEVSVIVVQGVEIVRPSWFREPELDLDQMMQQMGGRRNR